MIIVSASEDVSTCEVIVSASEDVSTCEGISRCAHEAFRGSDPFGEAFLSFERRCSR